MKKLLLSVSLVIAGGAFAQLSEDFEGTSGTALPSGWTQFTAATDGGFITTTDYTSTYFDFPAHTRYAGTNDDICNCDKSSEKLVSPAFTVTTAVLEFEYILGQYYGETGDLGVSMDGGATVTSLATLSPTNGSGDHVWTSFQQDISAYAGQTISIVWTYDDNADWGSGMMIDDVSTFTPPATDMEMTAYTTAPVVGAGMVDITGTVVSNGVAPVSSFDVTWDDGSGSNSATITPPSPLNFGDSYNFTHTTQLNATAGTTYNIDLCVVAVGDADGTNDCVAGTTSAVSSVVTKVVVGEEKTGEWCGWCPRGAAALAGMEISNPSDFIGIAVHNGDGMAFASYDGNIGTYVPGGYPGAGVDRVIDGDPSDFATMHAARAGMVPPASVSVSGTFDGTNLTVTATADFVGGLSGDYRLAVVVTEDNVTGAGQANYYSFQSNDIALVNPNSGSMANFDWQAATSTVNPVYHDHVARALGDDEINGAAGSLPASISAGASHSHTYTIPQGASWDMNNVHLVAMLVDGSTGEILNAGKGGFLGLSETAANNFSVNVAPNPTNGVASIIVDLAEASTMDVVVVDVLGKVVYTLGSTDLPAGAFAANVDLTNEAEGVYFAKVSVNGTVQTVKINVAK